MGVRLPAEYQEVEWIENTRNKSYWAFDIDSAPTVYKVRLCNSTGESWTGLSFTTAKSAYKDRFTIECKSNNEPVFRFAKYVNDREVTAISSVTNNTLSSLCEYDEGVCRVNSTIIGTLFMSGFEARALNIGGTIGAKRQTRFYYYEDDNRHLIPCYRKSDGIKGIYDLVSRSFNVGEGNQADFTVGLDVIDSISPWLVARRMGIVSQLARMNNPPDGAIFWNGVNCEDVQDGFSYYYKTGGGASSNIRITVENGALVIYKPTSANFDCQPRGDDIGLTGKHTVSVVCKISRPLSAGNDQLLFGITSGLNRTTRIVEKDITSDVTAEYKTFSVNFQSDESGWPFIRATGSSGKDPYSVIVKEWVIS